MSISSTTRKVGPSACNGVVTAFPFTFKVFQASDLLVVLTNASNVESTLTLTTDYTVSLNANQDSNPGGTITTNTAYATGNAITIGSNIPQTQTVTLTNNGGFYPTVLNDFFDKIVILVQQMTEKLTRAIALPFSAPSNISTTLPLPSAGLALKWAPDGLSIINSANDPDAAAAAAQVSATNAANSATAAATSAASAQTQLQTFQGIFYGSYSADPSTDPFGGAPGSGDLYWNTSSLKLRIYNGVSWQDSATAAPASFTSNLFSGTGAQTAFTLSSAPASLASTIVSIGGVTQRPTTDYTISGTTLTFVSAPPSGTNNILALVAASVAAGTPDDGSVSTAKLQNSSVTAAKIASGAIEGAVATAFSHRNKIINGAFDVWQRGTSYALTTAVVYGSADRFAFSQATAANGVANQVASGLTGFRYALKLGRNSTGTQTGRIAAIQALETANSIPLAGQTVTLSFYAKAGANFSAASSQMLAQIFTGTGTDQAAATIGAWTGTANPLNQLQAITTSWQRYSFTVTLSASATQAGILLGYTPTGTAGADDNLYITGIQLEAGSVATPFEYRNIQQELAMCQRYYFRITPGATNSPLTTGGFTTSATAAVGIISFPVRMRITPTTLDQSGVANQYQAAASSSGVTCSAVPTINANLTTFDTGGVSLTVASGLTANQPATVRTDPTNGATAYLGWSAEL